MTRTFRHPVDRATGGRLPGGPSGVKTGARRVRGATAADYPRAMAEIRDAQAGEIERLLGLWDELERAQGPYRVFDLAPDARESMRAEFTAAIDDPDRRLLVAEESGIVVGMALATLQQAGGLTGKQAVFLSRVVIDPAYRGKGTARSLVATADAFGRARGASHLVAYIFSGNTESLAAWHAMGFTDRFVQAVRPIAP